MTVRDTLADHVRSLLLVVGVGLLLLGGLGPGPAGPASALGVVALLSAVVLASPVADLLRTGGTGESEDAAASDDPVAALRERYVAGDLDESEFERRVERALAAERTPSSSTPSAPERDPEPTIAHGEEG